MQREPDDQTFWDEIEGYCGQLSYRPGETAQVHVSTKADTYDVVVKRWGASRVEVWRREGVSGQFHQPPDDADSMGCRWPVGVEVPVGSD